MGWTKNQAAIWGCHVCNTPDMSQYLVATYNYYMPLVYDYYAKRYVDNIYSIHKRKVTYVSTHWLADRNKYVLTINIKYIKSSYKCNFNGYVTLKYWSLPVVCVPTIGTVSIGSGIVLENPGGNSYSSSSNYSRSYGRAAGAAGAGFFH